jgi:hypothetical protein
MPIPLTQLDDRTFDDLVAEARALIPALHPQWTDHNPSDPGIALVELLAWLTEMLIFQVNEIPETHTRKFLALLNGPAWMPPAGGGLDTAVRETMQALHERYRAATPEDYEHLVGSTWGATEDAARLGPAARIRRVRCVPRRNLAPGAPPQAPDEAAPAAHVSVVVLPEGSGEEHPQPAADLTDALWRFLEPRRILTTRHHVVGPAYVDIGISANVAMNEDSPPVQTLEAVRDRLRDMHSPLAGGPDGRGWPFGRDVYASEVYAVLERIPLVDYVEDVRLTGPRPIQAADGTPSGMALDDHELVRLASVQLTGYDAYGRTFPLLWTATS